MMLSLNQKKMIKMLSHTVKNAAYFWFVEHVSLWEDYFSSVLSHRSTHKNLRYGKLWSADVRFSRGYSTLSWVRMCGPKFRPPPYNKTREDANLLPISKPFVSWKAPFKTNQCFLQCKLGCISTFWQPINKPKDKFIGNYAFCKNATYI